MKQTPIIFLDIDGVLNRHDYNAEAESATLCRECVAAFNALLHATGAHVVLSSAWRYMIHGGAITPRGFEYLLRTHGVTSKIKIVGVTVKDEHTPRRVEQIQRWLDAYEAVPYVILDDEPQICADIRAAGLPLVQTAAKIGLTIDDADAALRLLDDQEAFCVVGGLTP